MSAEVGIEELLQAHRGIDTILSTFYSDKSEEDDGEVQVVDVLTSLTSNSMESSQLINSFLEDVSALTEVRRDLAATTEKISIAALNETSSALTDPEVLGSRMAWCQKAEQHMRSIIENKDLLIYHLQQPLVANFLTMHYNYHKHLISLIGELVDILNNVSSHIRLIQDHAQNSILQRSDSCISSLTHTVTDLRDTINDITALQSLVTGMLNTKE
ncbi:uncharacterized protein [Cherax quadricarinatus]|nr:uncharacterized protein LOC128698072 isoform X2 [Cherax quadricarinatus]